MIKRSQLIFTWTFVVKTFVLSIINLVKVTSNYAGIARVEALLRVKPRRVKSGIWKQKECYFKLIVNNHIICPGGGTGRLGGFKILCCKACEFESRPGHITENTITFYIIMLYQFRLSISRKFELSVPVLESSELASVENREVFKVEGAGTEVVFMWDSHTGHPVKSLYSYRASKRMKWARAKKQCFCFFVRSEI